MGLGEHRPQLAQMSQGPVADILDSAAFGNVQLSAAPPDRVERRIETGAGQYTCDSLRGGSLDLVHGAFASRRRSARLAPARSHAGMPPLTAACHQPSATA